MAWIPIHVSKRVLEEEAKLLPAALANIVIIPIIQNCILPVLLDCRVEGLNGGLLLICQVLWICVRPSCYRFDIVYS